MERLNNISILARDLYNKQNIVKIDEEYILRLKFDKNDIKVPTLDSELLPFNTFLYHITVNAINYCYWQGSFDYRPNGMDSLKTSQLLLKYFRNHNNNSGYDLLKHDIKKALRLSGITLLEERTKHIDEIFDNINILEQYFKRNRDNLDALSIVEFLVENFDTYASDLFLKRAQLMPALLNREPSIKVSNLDKLLIPIDYQIPKILHILGVLEYSHYLVDDIQNGNIIHKNSREEMAIRSASIIATNKIMEIHNLTAIELDYFLIMRAKHYSDFQHHLTLTTEY